MFRVTGEITKSHMEGNIRVIDDVRVTNIGYYRGRLCLCPNCSDDCIAVTGSEYCGDCTVRHATGQPICH